MCSLFVRHIQTANDKCMSPVFYSIKPSIDSLKKIVFEEELEKYAGPQRSHPQLRGEFLVKFCHSVETMYQKMTQVF